MLRTVFRFTGHNTIASKSCVCVVLVGCAVPMIGCNQSSSETKPVVQKVKTASQSGNKNNRAGESNQMDGGTATSQNKTDSQSDDARSSSTRVVSTAKQREILSDANRSRAQGDIEKAWRTAKVVESIESPLPQLLMTAALIASERGDLESAVRIVDRVPAQDPEVGLPSLGQGADWLSQLGRLKLAEEKIESLIAVNDSVAMAHRLRVRIGNASGRRWSTRDSLRRLIELGDFTRDELAMLIDFSEPFSEKELANLAAQKQPNATYTIFGQTRQDIYKNRHERVLPILQQLLVRDQTNVDAWVWMGHTLIESGRITEMQDWFSKKPDGVDSFPQYWLTLGRWADATEQSESAAYAYAKSIELDTVSLVGHSRLAENLLLIGETEPADQIRKRAEKIAKIHTLAQAFLRGSAEPDAVEQIASLYADLNEDLLATAWTLLDMFNKDQNQQAAKYFQDNMPSAIENDQSSSTLSIVSKLRIDRWADKFDSSRGSKQELPLTSPSPQGDIRFTDVAKQLGIDAFFDNGTDMSKPGILIFQGNGGGVGVLDYDLDGWPDFYFSQAGGTPLQDGSNKPKSLFRSIHAERFVNVADTANVADLGYGEGIGVGDVNQDGFPDILVGNYGTDRLYINNGDGTFSESPIPQAPPTEQWSSSVAIADVTGDALPDLVITRYCSGLENLTKICESEGADSKNCPPNEFPPCQNDIYVSQGNGQFTRINEKISAEMADGRSLGVLIANIDRKNDNDVFISNDVSPNYLLMSKKTENGVSFTDQAGRRGVAVDSGGRAQACMGIAYGDIDQNGFPDIAVTNFLNDLNTLYLQRRPGMFIDGTRRTGFNENALDFLGFGCQFVDFEDDGWLDFAVVNGHIDDYRQLDVPFKMVPQIFQNNSGQFSWIEQASVGDYFSQPNIGRAMATVDFNRDHKIDLVITHLDRPVALLENQTGTENQFIEFELVGVQSERDATGAVVKVLRGEQKWMADETAGDGYMCSNQNLIHIGLGAGNQAVNMTVDWPSGLQQQFSNLAVGQRYKVVEGQSAFVLN